MDDKTRINALAEYLKVDPDEISNEYDNVFAVDNYDEYYVLTENEADEVIEEYIRSVISELGFDRGFTKKFSDFCLKQCEDTEMVDNFIDQEIKYFTEQEVDEDQVEYLKGLSGSEKIEYIRDMLGDDTIIEYLDIDKIVDEAIKLDGRAHFIADYDHQEIDLGNGLFAYRIN